MEWLPPPGTPPHCLACTVGLARHRHPVGGREGGCTVLRLPRPRGGLCSVAAGACERGGIGRRSKNRARGHWARAAPKWNRARTTHPAVCRVVGRGQGGWTESCVIVLWVSAGAWLVSPFWSWRLSHSHLDSLQRGLAAHRCTVQVPWSFARSPSAGFPHRPADLLVETSPIRQRRAPARPAKPSRRPTASRSEPRLPHHQPTSGGAGVSPGPSPPQEGPYAWHTAGT